MVRTARRTGLSSVISRFQKFGDVDGHPAAKFQRAGPRDLGKSRLLNKSTLHSKPPAKCRCKAWNQAWNPLNVPAWNISNAHAHA